MARTEMDDHLIVLLAFARARRARRNSISFVNLRMNHSSLNLNNELTIKQLERKTTHMNCKQHDSDRANGANSARTGRVKMGKVRIALRTKKNGYERKQRASLLTECHLALEPIEAGQWQCQRPLNLQRIRTRALCAAMGRTRHRGPHSTAQNQNKSLASFAQSQECLAISSILVCEPNFVPLCWITAAASLFLAIDTYGGSAGMLVCVCVRVLALFIVLGVLMDEHQLEHRRTVQHGTTTATAKIIERR